MTTTSQSALPGSTPPASAGQQPGPHDRRLAAPGRPDDPEQRGADEPRDELGHEPLAPEEVRRVGDVEGRQPLKRAAHRRVVAAGPRGVLARRLQLDHAAGQLGLDERSSARPAAVRPAAVVDAARRLAPRPAAGELVHPARERRRSARAATRRDVAALARRSRAPPPRRAARARARPAQRTPSASASRPQTSTRTSSSASAGASSPSAARQLGGRARQHRRGRPAWGARTCAKLAERGGQPRRRTRGRPSTRRRRPRDATSPASSAASRVFPMPSAPPTVTSRPCAGPRRLPMPAQPP